MDFKTTKSVLKNFHPSQSVLLKGNHGLGKSDCVRAAAKEMGIPCVDIRLSQCDVGDLKGLPFQVRGRTYFAPPDFFPLKEEDAKELSEFTGQDVIAGAPEGILFFDEFNRANREVQQVAFEIILDHCLNQRHMPEGWRVVAAINDDDNLYSVLDLDPALLDRFFVINFKPSKDEWFEWARKDGKVHDSILSFITKYPQFLDPTIEAIKDAGNNKVHGRRSWSHFSRTLNEYEKSGIDLFEGSAQSLNTLFSFAEGHVGLSAAVQYKTYVESDYQSLTADIILNKWDKGVKERITAIAEANRIPELATYNKMIVDFISAKVKDTLNKKQSENLANFVETIPNELVVDFWTKFDAQNRHAAYAWYKESPASKRAQERIMQVLRKPKE